MNTNGMFQSSEEERLKMMNCCCMPPSNALMPATDDALTSYTNVLISLVLISRIEQLEEELTKNGISIPEWKELLK